MPERTPAIDPDIAGAKGIAFRRARVEDANTIAGHRVSMFRDMGHHDESALRLMASRFVPWVEAKLESGDYLGWLAVDDDDHVVAGAGLWLMDWPAHMLSFSPRRGNIINVYTEPAFRRRGLARWLIEAALHSCKHDGIDYVILHASEQGRQLYERLGFAAGNEMRIKL